MAAPSYIFTIERVAQMLSESEELLEEIALDMDPEHGCIGVMGLGDDSTTAFTPDGVDYLREMIPEYKKQR